MHTRIYHTCRSARRKQTHTHTHKDTHTRLHVYLTQTLMHTNIFVFIFNSYTHAYIRTHITLVAVDVTSRMPLLLIYVRPVYRLFRNSGELCIFFSEFLNIQKFWKTCRTSQIRQAASALYLRAPHVPRFQKFSRTVWFIFSEMLNNLSHVVNSVGNLRFLFTCAPCVTFPEILKKCVYFLFRISGKLGASPQTL